MNEQPLAYHNPEFLESADARPIRILAEYLDPLQAVPSGEHPGHGRLFRLGARAQPAAGRAGAERAAAEARPQAQGSRAAAQAQPQGGRVVALLRGGARARSHADRLEPVARGAAAPLRRVLRRRAGHHGSREPRRQRSRRQDARAEHPPAVRAGAESATSPRGCTSSSITSSCGSSGSRTWPRRW